MRGDLHAEKDGRVLVARLSGTLSRADYERFVPEVDRQVARHGEVALLVEM